MSFEQKKEKKTINKNLTVPNAMSLFRILLIPFLAYYLLHKQIPGAMAMLALSALSDALDGIVARKFNQITELGKMLDPLADKLTQGTIAICMGVLFPSICPLLILLVVKEITMLCGAVYLLSHQKKPCAARWYGKVSTVLFYVSIALIVLMDAGYIGVTQEAFRLASALALVVTAAFMVYTFIRYFGMFREILRSTDGEYDMNLPEEIRATKPRN